MRALATIDPPPIDRGPSVGTSLIDINYGSRVGIATSITGPTSQALGDYEVIDAARAKAHSRGATNFIALVSAARAVTPVPPSTDHKNC